MVNAPTARPKYQVSGSNRNSKGMTIRYPSAAGSFYPETDHELRGQINTFFTQVRNRQAIKGIRAIIAPHAGYMYSGIVAASVYKPLIGAKRINRIIMLGPSHFVGFNYAGLTGFTSWETPLGQIQVDQEFNSKLTDNRHFKINDQAHEREHSLEVQIPFIQTIFGSNVKIVPIVLGQNTNFAKIAKRLSELLDGRTLIITSSDLSHYFTQVQANGIDHSTIDFILSRNSKDIQNEADACGLEGILVLNEIAKLKGWKPQLIDYKTSGDITDDKSSVVGYAGIIYTLDQTGSNK
jgi:MEMO1 family protein